MAKTFPYTIYIIRYMEGTLRFILLYRCNWCIVTTDMQKLSAIQTVCWGILHIHAIKLYCKLLLLVVWYWRSAVSMHTFFGLYLVSSRVDRKCIILIFIECRCHFFLIPTWSIFVYTILVLRSVTRLLREENLLINTSISIVLWKKSIAKYLYKSKPTNGIFSLQIIHTEYWFLVVFKNLVHWNILPIG